MEFHEVANIFPMMGEEEYEKLKSDIAIHGQREPIWTHDGKIVDGRNRYKACVDVGAEPIFKQWDGRGSLLEFVMSLNMHRRHLTASQKAVVSLSVEKIQAEEARERQRLAGVLYGENHKKEVPQLIAEPLENKGEARDKTAEIIGVNRQYISDAKRIQAQAPELLEPLLDGRINIPMAKILMDFAPEEREEIIAQGEAEVKDTYKRIKKEAIQRKEEAEKETQKATALDVVEFVPAKLKMISVTAGDYWQLGNHLLYCGDTSNPDWLNGTTAQLAFADPPYGAGVETFKDDVFYWEHDYLADAADVVCVTPGIVSIFEFARKTAMPYKWSISTWITNGMTRGALGFGNWIYTAVFSHNSVYRTAQDHYRTTISNSETDRTSHKGRKPSDYMVEMLRLFTKDGDTVIDPFLGSGTTLLVCETMGRKCVGGEIVPDFCADIIMQWEEVTGNKAVKL